MGQSRKPFLSAEGGDTEDSIPLLSHSFIDLAWLEDTFYFSPAPGVKGDFCYLTYSYWSGDIYTPETGEPEPSWVTSERQQFLEHRDINKDGKMDRQEIGHWILPTDYDHAEVESKHLLVQSDKDLVRTIQA